MFQRLLLAIDSSDAGPVATSFAIALATRVTAVRVVHVNQYQIGGRGLTVDGIVGAVEEAGLEIRGMLEAMQPIGRLVTADEVADAVTYLVGNAAVTGQGLDVDGGLLQS